MVDVAPLERRQLADARPGALEHPDVQRVAGRDRREQGCRVLAGRRVDLLLGRLGEPEQGRAGRVARELGEVEPPRIAPRSASGPASQRDGGVCDGCSTR